MTGRRGRVSALIVAATLLFSGVTPAWAAEPEPAPTVEPTVEPTPEAEPTEEPAPEPDPTVEPTEEPAPAEDPAPEPEPTDPPAAAGATVVYTGTLTRIADADDDSTLALLRTAQGYLAVDTRGWPASEFTTNVAVTLAVPSGVTLTGNAHADFTALSNAAASKALTIVGVGAARSLARETASLVNQTPNTAATHRIYAVFVTPNGKTTTSSLRPTEPQFAQTVVHADDYWSQQSSGTIGFELVGSVPWYSSSYSCKTTSGSFSLWNQAAAKAKSKLGYVAGKNNHLVLVFPSTTDCGGTIGLATIGWSANEGGLAWVIGDGAGKNKPDGFGEMEVQTLAHELGHNLSLGHANWVACEGRYPNPGVNLTGCDLREYGDITDVMGYGIPHMTGGALSSAHAIRAGIWPTSAWQYHTAAAGTEVVYTLHDVAQNSGLRSIVVQDSDGIVYFIEYRGVTDEDAQYFGYGCYSDHCVESRSGVRVLRLEQAQNFAPYLGTQEPSWLGSPGDGSYLMGFEATFERMNLAQSQDWWSRGEGNGIQVLAQSVTEGGATAQVRIRRGADSTSTSASAHVWIVPTSVADIENSMQVGDTWTAMLSDDWGQDTTSFQWYRGNAETSVTTPISGATAQNYTLTADDRGKYIGVTVTGTHLNGSVATISDPVAGTGWGPIGYGTYLRDQPGSVTIDNGGDPLVAVTADWPSGTTFAYQWYSGTSATSTTKATGPGSTSSNYSLVAGDQGKYIRVKVTATVPGYKPVERFSGAKNYTITASEGVFVSGMTAVGSELSVQLDSMTYTTVDGTLTGVSHSFQWLRDGKVIPGATESTYDVQGTDYGKKISVRLTASKSGWIPLVRTSPGVKITMKAPFTINEDPIITQNGLTLTVSPADLAPEPTTVTYQWYRNGKKVKGATKPTYTLTAADYMKEIDVYVTHKRSGYADRIMDGIPVSGDAVYSVYSGSAKPVLGGEFRVGGELEVVDRTYYDTRNGHELEEGDLVRTYQWYADGKAISGATGATFTLTPAQKGKAITVKMTVRAAAGDLVPLVSTSEKTQKIGTEEIEVDAPSVDIMSVGTTFKPALKATAMGVTELGVAYKYQWYRDGKAIKGATKQTYALTSKDRSAEIVVAITVSKKAQGPIIWTNRVITSASKRYAIRGEDSGAYVAFDDDVPQVGSVASVDLQPYYDSWTEITLSELVLDHRYQWLRNGKAIKGATGATYILTASDYGKKISVKVTTGSQFGGDMTHVGTYTSDPASLKVAKGVTTSNAAFTVQPAGAGKLRAVYTASSLVPEYPTPKYSYQWYRGDAKIKGATKSTYTLTSSDRGKQISVQVTMKRSNFTQVTTVLPRTAPVNYTLMSHDAPELTGTPAVGGTMGFVTYGVYESDGTTPFASPQLSYQWYRNGSAISGAKGETYVVKSADAGKKITVKVTVKGDGRLGFSMTSAPVPIPAG